MVDAEYPRIVTTDPLKLIAFDADENVYAPLLLLIPDITAASEKDISVPYVFEIWATD